MKKIIVILRYFVLVHLTALTILSLFRIFLFFENRIIIADVENTAYLLTNALAIGLKFDNLVSCYILFFPLVITSILVLANKLSSKLITVINIYFVVLYSLVFAVSAADVPYFSYFFKHLGIGAFDWFKFGSTTVGLLFNKSYCLYIISFVLACSIFAYLVFVFSKKMLIISTIKVVKKEIMRHLPFLLIIWGTCFIGVRGGFQRYPLGISFAYFSENSFFNQLGVNPAFFLLKSCEYSTKKKNNVNNLMKQNEAIQFVKDELGVKSFAESEIISRQVKCIGQPVKANVVVVLMESLSSFYLDWEHKGRKTMPFLNELISKSYYFNNFYSSGVHTNNGIVSTLYGFPPQFNEPMMSIDITKYKGLPYWLDKKGYETLFFITGNPQYDNMNSFLRENNIKKLYSLYDYPNEKVANNFGVQDDYLFEFGLDKLNGLAKAKKPFLATFLTVSHHPPYVIPEKFKNIGVSDDADILAFADYSIQNFMTLAAKEEWYKNTIFVFVGDHGVVAGQQKYSMPLSQNHIPLIIYSSMFEDAPKVFDQLGGQIDVFPTVMGLLNESYTNNSLGVDLMKKKRPCMFFMNDNQLGCINNNYFYIRNLSTATDELFNLQDSFVKNIADKQSAILQSLKKYSVSMAVTSDYLISNKMTY